MPALSLNDPNAPVARGHEDDLMVVAPDLGSGTVGVQFADWTTDVGQQPSEIARLKSMRAGVVAKPANTLARANPPRTPFTHVGGLKKVVEPVADTGNLCVPPVAFTRKAGAGPENAGCHADRRLDLESNKTKKHGSVLPGGQALSDDRKRQSVIGHTRYARADWFLGFGDMIRNMGRDLSSERASFYGDLLCIF